jgi:uncharacterized damage-inducible protein DinB
MNSIPTHHYFHLMADYNAWMNQQIYQSAGQLSLDQLTQDRRAFFGSILGTLNHLVVADMIWLKRFASYPRFQQVLAHIYAYPQPLTLDELLYQDLSGLYTVRLALDQLIYRWVHVVVEDDLSQVLTYTNSKGVVSHKLIGHLMLHFFNHHTHHRGQLSTLLYQAGINIGITDLLVHLPDQS